MTTPKARVNTEVKPQPASQNQHSLLLTSCLLCLLTLWLSGCGWQQSNVNSSTPTVASKVQADRVRIEIDMGDMSSVTLATPGLVRQLYTTIYGLPQMPTNIACTQERGPHYTLTFQQGSQVLTTVKAERDGCRPVSIAGEARPRQASAQFWTLLDQATNQASPPAQLSSLAIMQPGQPPQVARITDSETVQRFYNAVLQLPLVSSNDKCIDNQGPIYQFAFRATDHYFPSALNKGCGTITLNDNLRTRTGTYKLNDNVLCQFEQMLTSVTFTPARPDHLTLGFTKADASQQAQINDAVLIQKLYVQIDALPAYKLPANCNDDKASGKARYYSLFFSQWDLPIRNVSTFEGSHCSFVQLDEDGRTLQGDQTFWDLLHRAAGEVS